MNKKAIFLIILYIPLAWSEHYIVILQTDLKTVGLVEVRTTFKKSKDALFNNVMLMGKCRSIVNDGMDKKIVQILWTDVVIDSKKKVSIEKPFLSTFKTSLELLPKGTEISFDGNNADVKKAIQQCLNGKRAQVKTNLNGVNLPSSERNVVVNGSSLSKDNKTSHDVTNNIGGNLPESNVQKTGNHVTQDSKSHQGINTANQESNLRNSSNSFPSNSGAVGQNMRANSGFDYFGSGNLSNLRFLEPNNDQAKKTPDKSTNTDQVSVQTTKDGCLPFIDLNNNRVIIQNRVIKHKGTVRVEKGKCTDTLETYLIKKDTLCSECKDIIDFEQEKVFPTYEQYWVDRDSVKHVITDHPEKDERKAFPIIEEKSNCKYFIDRENNVAIEQVESLYYNRLNIRRIAKPCHTGQMLVSIPIVLTTKGCVPTNDFAHDWSILQKKGVFLVDGQEQEAFSCQEVGHPIPHEFDWQSCQPKVDVTGKTMIYMAKRYISVDGDRLYIKTDCEPYGNQHNLKSMRQGCEGEFIHNYKEKRSYYKRKWYYDKEGEITFVTECINSNDFVPFQVRIMGFINDDEKKEAKQRLSYYIETEDGTIDLGENISEGSMLTVPYAFIESVTRTLSSYSYDGCYRLTDTELVDRYRRADGSTLEEKKGKGDPVRGADECRRETEERFMYDHTSFKDRHTGKFQVVCTAEKIKARFNLPDDKLEDMDGTDYTNEHRRRRMYRLERRVTTYFPDGHTQIGEWEKTEIIFEK